MERGKIKQVIEAALFLKEEPLKPEKMAEILEVPVGEIKALIAELQQEMAESGRALRVYEVAGGYQMGTLPDLAEYLERFLEEEVSGSLSPASLETLAIIAYKQPVTRLEIESIRAVKSEYVLETLLKRKLIRISGRKKTPGRPLLYSTSLDFLKYFGLKNLEELPCLEDMAADAGGEQEPDGVPGSGLHHHP